MNSAIKLVLAGALGLVSSGSLAQEVKHGALTIEQSRVRVTIPGRPAGGYMVLKNLGDKADKLLSAASPMAKRVELHTVTMKDGIMRMRRINHIEVPAKGHVELKPGSRHFMIFGLEPSLKPGDKLPLSLVFKNAGTIKVEAEIMGMGKMKMGGHSGHGEKRQ